MSDSRQPAAFPVKQPPQPAPETRKEPPLRRPQAVRIDETVSITPAELDIFDQQETVVAPPPPAVPRRKRFRLGTIFFTAVGLILSLAAGLRADRLIRGLFARAGWLRWPGTVPVAAAALLAPVVRGRQPLA